MLQDPSSFQIALDHNKVNTDDIVLYCIVLRWIASNSYPAWAVLRCYHDIAYFAKCKSVQYNMSDLFYLFIEIWYPTVPKHNLSQISYTIICKNSDEKTTWITQIKQLVAAFYTSHGSHMTVPAKDTNMAALSKSLATMGLLWCMNINNLVLLYLPELLSNIIAYECSWCHDYLASLNTWYIIQTSLHWAN